MIVSYISSHLIFNEAVADCDGKGAWYGKWVIAIGFEKKKIQSLFRTCLSFFLCLIWLKQNGNSSVGRDLGTQMVVSKSKESTCEKKKMEI